MVIDARRPLLAGNSQTPTHARMQKLASAGGRGTPELKAGPVRHA